MPFSLEHHDGISLQGGYKHSFKLCGFVVLQRFLAETSWSGHWQFLLVPGLSQISGELLHLRTSSQLYQNRCNKNGTSVETLNVVILP